jgi:hypothetical protein
MPSLAAVSAVVAARRKDTHTDTHRWHYEFSAFEDLGLTVFVGRLTKETTWNIQAYVRR